jgi:hypothetical protein
MVFNGHTQKTIDNIDEDLFTDIQVMYSDGVLGNQGTYEALAPITAAVFNYFRPQGAKAMHSDQIFPWVHEYKVNPDFEKTDAQKANEGLLLFMTQAQGFDLAKFQNGSSGTK